MFGLRVSALVPSIVLLFLGSSLVSGQTVITSGTYEGETSTGLIGNPAWITSPLDVLQMWGGELKGGAGELEGGCGLIVRADSVVEVHGGQLEGGPPEGEGTSGPSIILEGGTLRVYGTSLKQSKSGSTITITGTLQDGSSCDMTVQVDADSSSVWLYPPSGTMPTDPGGGFVVKSGIFRGTAGSGYGIYLPNEATITIDGGFYSGSGADIGVPSGVTLNVLGGVMSTIENSGTVNFYGTDLKMSKHPPYLVTGQYPDGTPLSVTVSGGTVDLVSQSKPASTLLLLWEHSGAALNWILPEAKAPQQSPVFGPLDRSAPVLTAGGADGLTRTVWRESDGSIQLWTQSGDLTFYRSTNLKAPLRSNFVDFKIAPNDTPYALWYDQTNQTATVWELNAEGTEVEDNQTYLGPKGLVPVRLALGYDEKPRILWADKSGNATIWTLEATLAGQPTQNQYGLSGARAVDLSVGTDGTLHLIWTAPAGVDMWRIRKEAVARHTFGHEPGWSLLGAEVGPDDRERLLWTGADGWIDAWTISADWGYSSRVLCPGPGWTVVSMDVAP